MESPTANDLLLDSIIEKSKAVDGSQAKSKRMCSKIASYPKGVFFMLGCEFAERFSFYGLRAIMILYFVSAKALPPSSAKLLYHGFVFLAHFTPIFGSILADGFFGKFKVILSLCVVYAFGHILLTAGAVPYVPYDLSCALDYIGLIVIAIASGGIRPCGAAFAADQFDKGAENDRRQFFSFFYFAINLGALLSMVLLPGLRAHVHCFGQSSCFALAFSVPSFCLIFVTLLFLSGKKFYRMNPPTKNIIGEVCGCIYSGIKGKVGSLKKNVDEKQLHWLDYAKSIYSDEMVSDVKTLLSVCMLYLPIIPFWALYDQMGSTWVLQANSMNGRMGRMTVLPDQMAMINAVLVVALVPLFEGLIYPTLARCNILKTSLRRMAYGGLLAATSFVVAGLVQMMIANNDTTYIPNDQSRVLVLNAMTSETVISDGTTGFTVSSGQHFAFDSNQAIFASNCSQSVDIEKHLLNFVLLSHSCQIVNTTFPLAKTADGLTRLYVQSDSQMQINEITVVGESQTFSLDLSSHHNSTSAPFLDVEPGFFGSNEFTITINSTVQYDNTHFEISAGSAFVFVILKNQSFLIPLVSGNNVNMMWQLPQYILITVAEIMFSITGLEFSYSESPESMTSMLQAIWLLTGAIGNLLAAVISGSNIVSNPSSEFFLYAVMMYAVMVIFILFARKYKSRERNEKKVSRERRFSNEECMSKML